MQHYWLCLQDSGEQDHATIDHRPWMDTGGTRTLCSLSAGHYQQMMKGTGQELRSPHLAQKGQWHHPKHT